MHILPNKMWLNKWFQRSKELLPLFSKMNSYEALEAICILSYSQSHKVSNKWMKEWFLNNENHIAEFSLNQFTHILSLVGRIHIEPPSSWIEKCKKRFPELLEEFNDRKVIGVNVLFWFADAFNISEVRKDVKLVSVWLDKSLATMNEVNANYAIGSLLSLAHTDVLVSLKWIDVCLEKVIYEIELSYERSLVLKNIANALYSLTLMNIERSHCQSFLEKCNTFFKKNEKQVFSDNEHLLFRKIIFSKNYFELFGFTLCVDPRDYPTLNNWLQTKERTSSEEQDMFGEALTILFGNRLIKEAYIPLITDSVDFLIKEQSLVIEVDGHSHRLDGVENALTRTKSLMLKKCGYAVVRFPAGYADCDLLYLLENKLSAYIPK